MNRIITKDERKNLVYEGFRIWYMMSSGKTGLPRVTAGRIKRAHEANANWIERSEGKEQSIINKELNKMFQSHPHEIITREKTRFRYTYDFGDSWDFHSPI